ESFQPAIDFSDSESSADNTKSLLRPFFFLNAIFSAFPPFLIPLPSFLLPCGSFNLFSFLDPCTNVDFAEPRFLLFSLAFPLLQHVDSVLDILQSRPHHFARLSSIDKVLLRVQVLNVLYVVFVCEIACLTVETCSTPSLTHRR